MSNPVSNPVSNSVPNSVPNPKLLIIGTVWPEPTSSAAGTRTMELIQFFQSQGFQSQGYDITFASHASKTEHSVGLKVLGISEESIELNNSSFDDFVRELEPNVVIFDRFMTEEQFGWRVQEQCPDALRILDTVDLHCLRKARHEAFKATGQITPNPSKEYLFSDYALREIAAIYRSDLNLMISTKEIEVLHEHFSVPLAQLHYLPFLLDPLTQETIQSWKTFEERQHFMTIGNFLHDPNWDAVLYLKQDIWPRIRQALPKAELHIYGAYVPQKALQLHNPKEGFLVLGRAESATEVMAQSKVCLAPLRFGAGMKGKLIDAMLTGTPSVTTSIGAESMYSKADESTSLDWAGFIEDDVDAFVAATIKLYTEKDSWLDCQKNSVEIINECFDKRVFGGRLELTLSHLLANLQSHRLNNFTGKMLNHHSMKSTYYMSKWIESKNSK